MDTQLTRVLGAPVPEGTDPKFIQTIAPWLGVPYQLGGNTKTGTDCSGLIGAIYHHWHGWHLPRTTAALYKAINKLESNTLLQGDLVFFKINTAEPGHAGLYLWQGYFLHATTSKGVIISNLNEVYWSKYFVGAGQLNKMKP